MEIIRIKFTNIILKYYQIKILKMKQDYEKEKDI